MTQEQQKNSILKEEDKILKVRQGGVCIWGVAKTPYCSYGFLPQKHEQQFNKEIIKEFYNIAYELMEYFSENRVCRLSCYYDKKERHHNRKNKFTHPVYITDGKVNEFKQYLINSNRKDLIWTDYMCYISDVVDYFLFKREVRNYDRNIYILQEKIDLELVKKTAECDQEGINRTAGIFIYPHSKIKHKENDRETVISYVHDRDTFIEICISDFDAMLVIEPNPKYITYDQLLKEIEPIFNKYGWKFGDMTNPYIKALKCDVNCLDCDDLECNYNLKDNEVYHYVYHRVDTD